MGLTQITLTMGQWISHNDLVAMLNILLHACNNVIIRYNTYTQLQELGLCNIAKYIYKTIFLTKYLYHNKSTLNNHDCANHKN